MIFFWVNSIKSEPPIFKCYVIVVYAHIGLKSVLSVNGTTLAQMEPEEYNYS